MATQTLDSIIRAGITRGDKGEKGEKGVKGAQLQSATYTTANDTVTFTNSDSSTVEFNGVKGSKGEKGVPGEYAGKGEKGDTGALGYGGPKITNIQVANSSYSVTGDVAVSTSGGYIVLTGSSFMANCNVVIGNIPATSVTYVDANTVHAQIGGQTAGSYHAYLVNEDGGTAIRLNAVTFGQSPGWITDATLPTFLYSQAIYVYLNAVSDSVVTYSVAAGSSLPSGLTLAANGLLSGTASGISANTTFNFTVEATDSENQTSSRSFSMTVSLGQFAQVSNLIDKMQATTTALVLDNPGIYGSGGVTASANGYRIAVGNPYESKNNSTIGVYAGSVQVWQRTSPTSNTWSAFQKITSGTSNTMFGANVVMSSNGDLLAVGETRQGAGRVTIFSLANNEYKAVGSIYNAGLNAGGMIGSTMAMSPDDKYLVVGGPNTNTISGYVQLFNISNPASPNSYIATFGANSEYLGAAVAIAGRDDANGYMVAALARAACNSIRIYRGNTQLGFSGGTPIGGLTSAANTVAIAPDMSFIAIGGLDEAVRIYDNTATTILKTITPSDGAAGDNFGEQISITKYGSNNYLLISSDSKDDPVIGANVGSVYVYTGSNATNWTYVTQIMPAESANSGLGQNFAGVMCSNSNIPIIVTGAPRQTTGQQNGVVYITTSTNTFSSFSTQRVINIPIMLTPITGAGMSKDGNIIALGMANDSSATAASGHGSIALYEKSGNTYINTARFYGDSAIDARTAPTIYNMHHGQNISISANGLVIAVGNPNRDANSILTKMGSVHVHMKNLATGLWRTSPTLFANITSTSQANAQIGTSVAIYESGTLLVAGAPYASYGNTGGVVYWAYQSTPVWSAVGANTNFFFANTQPGDGFGYSVSTSRSMVTSDTVGLLVATGAPFATSRTGSANTQEGYATIFRVSLTGNAAAYITQIRSSDIAAGDQFGYSVALSPDGRVLAVGAPGRDDVQSGAGAVYVFTNNGADEFVQSAKLQAADPAQNDRFGSYVTMSSNSTIYVGAQSADVHSRTDSGAAYKFTKSGGTWAQTAKFISNNAAFAHDGANFGAVIAPTSDDTSVLILAPNDKASSTGSAYLFTQTL